MNDTLIIPSISFLATGAAWGMAWLGGFGSLKKDMGNASLLKFVSLVFVVAGSIYACHILYDLYGKYSVGSAEEKELFLANFTGKNFVKNGGRLLIHFSPLFLILPLLRKSRVVCGVIGTCYVLIPFYNLIIDKIGA